MGYSKIKSIYSLEKSIDFLKKNKMALFNYKTIYPNF